LIFTQYFIPSFIVITLMWRLQAWAAGVGLY